MNCEWVKANITLYTYDELADDARIELEQHVQRCGDCANELKSMQDFREQMSAAPRLEPSPSFLAASRMRLQEALETTEQERRWRRLFFDPAAWLRQMKFNPALAAVLLIIGFVGGGITAYQMGRNTIAPNGPITKGLEPPQNGAQAPDAMSIAGIRAITQDPNSNKVEIKYDALQPQTVEGSLNDARIQQLLLFAARNNNSGVRQDSIDLLTQRPQDAAIREALVSALRYDTNPGVRIKSLDALGPYVKNDVSVRDAMIEAVLHDTNPGVRAEALHMLQPVKADSSVRMALQYLADKDKDTYIRRQSRNMLNTLPEID
ncbi:MAG TPA: HEAT repeat domain-containing protein [Terriglobales bacterium]|nr:HEAT repeat domain-containing protein [Terriglobales bacterium]